MIKPCINRMCMCKERERKRERERERRDKAKRESGLRQRDGERGKESE